MSYKTVTIQSQYFVQKEYVANAAITPGHLVQLMSTGKVRVHANAGQNAQRMFAVEDDIQGNEIGTAYSSGNIVLCRIFQRGDEVYAILTTSQTIAINDMLDSTGDGTLKKHTADSAGVVEYPEAIVAIALEAVTTTSAVARIRVEII